jgi:hypothetical protein
MRKKRNRKRTRREEDAENEEDITKNGSEGYREESRE